MKLLLAVKLQLESRGPFSYVSVGRFVHLYTPSLWDLGPVDGIILQWNDSVATKDAMIWSKGHSNLESPCIFYGLGNIFERQST